MPSRYVVAHRGARGNRPENTMVSFAHAVEVGAHALEMDVHLSADGELMVIHDDFVDRVTEGGGAVAGLSCERLRELDAGYWFSPDGVTYPWRGQGVRIPTLAEVFDEFPTIPKVIEIKPAKPAVAQALAAFLQGQGGRMGQTLVGSFHDEMLQVFRRHYPGCPTSAGPVESRAFVLRALFGRPIPESLPYQALTIPLRKYGIPLTHPRVVQRANEKGLHIQVWTINDPDRMSQLFEAGVHAVTTDHPRRAVDALREWRDRSGF